VTRHGGHREAAKVGYFRFLAVRTFA
jgi:hypothetical protein